MKDFLKRHQWKIIIPVLAVCVLVFAFWYGGNAPGLRGWEAAAPSISLAAAAPPDGSAAPETPASAVSPSETVSPSVSPPGASSEPSAKPSPSPSPARPSPSGGASAAPGAGSGHALSADEKLALAAEIAGDKSSAGVQKGDTGYSEGQGMQLDPSTGKDKYQTDPVPSGKPVPVEPQDARITDMAYTCTLSVRCDTILDNMSWLDQEKHELVPPDGVIFPATKVTFYEGESVFNVLQREMKKAKIQMEFENTPMYNSAYIEGINNLYEFDVGELSGWMYKVNDWFPNYGCSRYQLKDGDVIEWVYTCDLGIDVGGYYSTGS
ncbi:protein of unknown function [Sporobacter termitidis DSM 10068]|uniref:Transcobalamin-like C-terminal domain-containing protein n=1 Tax=Sporobacter termitidis DSM 10068 TaxID=1123282 RepID=A0A1M5YSA4_9FIRM|nr:DUF4430 domain-containing protein [Sporobacter termitidis]SHI14987.1 protein of unknown function [Sporobacter termitidis DSM 10068]